MTAGISLFVASAVAALAATDFSDYNGFSSASSTTVSSIRIGATTDSESYINSNALATGDDLNGTDDEDGVTLPSSLVAGTTGSMVVNVTNTSGATVFLNAWIDYNKNGSLTDSGEQIASNTTISTGTSNSNRTLTFTVPSGATLGDVGVRVRLTSTSSPGSTSLKGNGEVEDYLVQICPAITVGPTTLGTATVGTAYSQTISAGGGSAPYSFSVSSGTLPGGLSLSSGGALTGTPTSGDTETFTIKAVDQSGCVGTRTYTMTPTCTSYVISPFAMGSWDLSTTVNVTLVATATSGSVNTPLTWSRSSGTLPAGLSLSSAGVLSGTTTAKGTSSFTVQVTDSYGCSATQSYLMTVASGTSYSSLLYVSTGNGSTGYLETYDVSTGAKTLVGQTRDSSSHYLTDLAWSPSGILYGIDFNNIYQINPSTGAVTKLGSFGSSNSFNGMVFDSAGTPYISSVSNGDIYTFNLSSLSTSSNTSTSIAFTAPATVPNGQALNSAGDMAWIGNELYYTTAGSGFTSFYLYKVPEGGTSAQLVGQVKNTSGSNISDVFGLSTDGYGTLYAQAGNALYTLNKTTAVATTITSSMASNAVSGGAMRYEFTQVLDDFGDYSGFGVARDTVFSSLLMGSLVDYDIPAAFNTAANSDDLAWTDDEDGVTLPASVVQGATGVSVTVKVTNTSGAPAFLNGWIDFANNGSLTDSGDQIINNVVIPSGTNNVSQNYTFNVPANAAVGSLGARFRLTAVTNPGPSGASGPGEVEDYLFNVTCSTITLTPTTLAAPTVGTAYSKTVTASGGNGPYTYAVATGALPAGLTLNSSSGVISGTVTSSSATSFTLRATDAKGCTGTLAISMTPTCPAVTVTPASLNTPAVGISFSQTLSAAGGVSPYTWAITSGSLPAGLTLSASSGTISGLPTSSAAATFSVRATDAAGCTKTQSYTVTPACPTISISPSTLTAGTVGTAYSQTLNASGGTAAYTSWTVTSGTLPSGLTLNSSTGIISGTPTTSASPSTSVTVRVNDAYGCQGSQVVTLQICPIIAVTPSILPTPTVGTAYSQTLTASGGAAAYTYTLASGSLPSWATLSSAGVLSGTPNSDTASTFTVLVTDANGCSNTLSYTVTPVCPTVTITPATLATGTVGSSYSQRLSATGGIAPYSGWAVTAGTLPAGLTLNASTGVISGTPTASASPSTSVTVQVNDANGCEGTRAITLQICPVITFSPTTLTGATVGTSYSKTITASGGTGPYTCTLASGTLPAWASLTAAGVLSGTPTSTATSIFTLRYTDANGCSATLAYTLTPQCPTITVTPSALAAGTVGTAYSQTLSASGGIAPYGTWTITGGTLPAGLTLNASTGVVSGTPTASASPATTITFRVNDANGCQGTRAVTLQICPAITLAPTTPASGTVGVAYSQTITPSGGSAAYTFAVVSGSLPAGLSLNASTGVVSGTPTSQTSGTVTIRATDANGCQGSRAMTFAMGCPVITIANDTLPLGTVGSAYSQTLSASGGSSSYTWSVTSGTLPAGLTLSSAGVLSGTPTTGNAGGVNVTISATDSANSCAATKTYSLQICPVVTLSPTTLSVATVGTAYSQTITTSGGAAPYTYTLVSGTLPTWATLSSAGVLSGTPTTTTSATFTLGVTDANGCTGTRAYTLTPSCATITISPTTLGQGTVGTAYSQSLAASGGTAPFSSWTIISGSLPTGLSLNSSTGVISGTPTATASPATSIIVRVNDANGCQGSQTLALQVCPVITLAPATLTTPTVGVAYSQTVSASGGASPYTFTLASGSLPAWATLSSAGVISGTPNNTTTAAFTVRATDANGCAKTQACTLAPVCPTISILPSSLAQGVVGSAYSQALTASGGSAAYTWALTSGTLPTGLTLGSSTGVISGTPTAVNASGTSLTFRATDANGCQAFKTLTLQVCPAISVTPTSAALATVGSFYSQALASSGGTSPYTYSISNGTLPAGLLLSSSGVISGTPTTANGAGSSFTVRSMAANGCLKDQVISLKICPVISLSPLTTTWTVGVSSSQTLSASGGTAPYVFAFVSGTLPAGVTFNASTGVLSGTPTNAVSCTFVISATSANGCVGSLSYTITPQCPVISVSPGTLAVGMVGSSYAQTFITAGGIAPYTYEITGGSMPAGLNFDTSTGAISGTPTVAGTSTLTVNVTDSNSCQTTITRSIIISAAAINCPTTLNQSVGGAYLVTRLGRDVLGGENNNVGTCLYNMSPNGRWITGIRVAKNSYAFVMNTLTNVNVNVPLLDSKHPYAMGRDVNDSGDTVGYEKWTTGSKLSIVPWFYSQASGTTVRLLTPYDSNLSMSAIPSALTSDSAYAFGTVDPDGPGRPVLAQGGYWNLNTRAWTQISGVREVIDASADGTMLLVTDSSGVGKVLSGSPAAGYSTVVVTFTGGSLNAGRISPSGRYIGSSQRLSGVPTPFVYDTESSTRTNLPRILPQDSLGGIVGAVSDTGRVLGTLYSSASTGSFAVMWDTPADLYTRISDLLVSDGHVAQDNAYSFWNLYNGGDGISADGTTMGVYGDNPYGLEDSMVFQKVDVADTRLCLGNSVWQDTNRNGIKDYGEPGAVGAVAHLFHPGADGVRGGTGENADYEIGTPVTITSSGVYIFSDLPSGLYYVQVIPPASLPLTSGVVVALDNGVDNDNNGMQPGGPGTPIYSPMLTLIPGTESVNDGDSNTNTDFTVDFALGDGVSVGDLVFADLNGDGLYDSNTESGQENITVQLLDGTTNNVLLTTTTDASGAYFFGGQAPGTYRVNIPTPPAIYTSATLTVYEDNGVDNDSNGAQNGGAGTATISPVITLAAGTEPGSTGSSSFENTIDFGFRSCPVIAMTPTTLTSGLVGTAYEQTMSASGSSATPYTWSTSSGTWPEGLSISSTGSISGTPTASTSGVNGTTVTVRAIDANTCFRDQTLKIKICPVITVNPTTLPPPVIGSPYAQTITSSGTTAMPVVYSTTGLPAWLYLNESTGVLSGTPTNSTAVTFTVTATDANLCSASRTYTLPPVCPAVTITPASPAVATVGVPYSQALSASPTSGLTGQYFSGSDFRTLVLTRQEASINYDWADGTPDALVPVDRFSVRWSGFVRPATTGTYTFQSTSDDGVRVWVNNTLVIDKWQDQSATNYTATVNLTAGVVVPIRVEYYEAAGQAVMKLQWSGPNLALQPVTGWLDYVWGVSGGVLPAGLSLNATTAVISGTPTAANGVGVSFTITATDANGCVGSQVWPALQVCPAMTLSPATLPPATVGQEYSQTVAATGGTAPYQYSVVSGDLPAWCTLNAATGKLTGTPTDNSPGNFTLQATDANGCSTTQIYTLDPRCTIFTVTPGTLPSATAGTAYSQALASSGGTGPYTYTLSSGTLPAGITLSSDGVLSGTAATGDGSSSSITVGITDSTGCLGSATYQVKVCPVITLSPTTLPAPFLGLSYSQTITTSGTSATPLTWSATGLPAWLSINSSTGVLSGTATENTPVTFTLTATDANGCAGSRTYTTTPVCPVITVGGTAPSNGYLQTSFAENITGSGGTAPYSFVLVSGSLPPGLSLASNGSVSGTPTTLGTYTVTVRATDAYSCQSTATAVTYNIKGMGIGNQVWVDMDDNGLRGASESGVPNLPIQLWSPGINGVVNNGSGDDVLLASTTTDSDGAYLFNGLAPATYYVRIPTPPTYYPKVSTSQVNLDNGVNNDNNGIQAVSGLAVVTPLITLYPNTEAGAGVDGDDTDFDSTIDIGFANANPCQITNLIDNPSFELLGLPNATGTATSVLGYDGTGTTFGSGINAYQWLGGTNGTSGIGEPIQRVQVAAGSSGSKVSWVESVKSRHGKRMVLLQGTNSAVNLLPAGGGGWSTVLQAGKEYELSVWASSASSGAASILWNLGANAQIFQVITGATPGLYQYYTVPQGEMSATAPGVSQCCGYNGGTVAYSAFGASDYNNWTEATASSTQPLWRQFTYHFRVANGATQSQIDTASIALSGGSSTNAVAADLVYLCQVNTTATLTLGNLVWNDANNNGVRDTGTNPEIGISSVTVDLFRSINDTAGDADDLLIATTTTNSAGAYNFTGLADGKYVVRVTPPASIPSTGGNVVALDNGVNNDNNGSQPGGPGTYLYSPVVTLASGTEPTNDGDTNPDTELSIDFGLFSGIQLGNQLFIDANNDGVFSSATENGVGSGVTVELLDGTVNTVIASTTTNSSGVYGFTVYQPANYRVRIPTPPVAYPLASGVVDTSDDGRDNDSNGIQTGGIGTAVISPVITLTAGGEPGSSGNSNTENTIDFGFRGCPTITITPGTVAVATQYVAYNPLSLSSSGGAGGYVYAISSGALPSGMTMNSAGVISGTPGASAAPGSYSFTVRSTDSIGCSGTQNYTLTLSNAIVTVNPATLPAATQYAAYTQNLSASGGTSPYAWSYGPSALTGTAAWWPGENGATEVVAGNNGALMNGVAFTTGLVGSAFSFDGVNDYLQVADQSVMRPVQISLEAWVRPTSAAPAADQIIIAKTSSTTAPTNGYGLIQRSGTSTVRFWINGPNSVAGTSEFVDAPVTVGSWNHVVATYDLTNIRIYVNGVQIASKAFTTAISHSTQPLVMGGSATTSTCWNGALDEAVLYNRALSLGEALARYDITNTGNNGMPTGLTLNTTTGVLSGTPTALPASYPFTVRATDSFGGIGLRSYSLTVGCPTLSISPGTFTDATQYAAYTAVTMTATGGTAPYQWDITTGALPTGMSLSTAGVISGTPGSAPATYSFTVRARDANNCVSTKALTVKVICPAISLTPSTLPNAQQFASYSAVLLDGTGGSSPYTFAIQSGSLPTGMSLSVSGLLSGTPTATPGDYTVVVKGTDSASCSGTRSYTLHVNCPAIAISPTTLPNGRQYQAYSQTLTASNGNSPYTWSLVSGALPTGLSLSTAGVISGTPTAVPGTYTFRVQTTDSFACVGTRDYSILFDCPLISITPTTLPQATTTEAYSQQLTASGGTSPYTWTLASGALPSGITFSSSGLISGTTSAVGSFNFTAQASDLNGCVVQQALALGVNCAAITISPSSLSTATVGTAYSQQFTSSGGVGTKTWTVKTGSLPVGMTLSTAGLLSGTPTDTAGTFSFTIQAMDQNNCPGTSAYTLTLQCPAVTITPSSVPNGTVATSYSTTLTASGATAPYTWSLQSGSTLPSGLALSPTGVISGTPTVPGSYSFGVTARGSYACTGTTTITMTVVCPTLALSPSSLSSGYRGVAYSQTVTASGGISPYTYSVTAGSLPPGVTLNTSSGVISGTPTAAGSYSFTVRGLDSATCSGTRDYIAVINGLSLGNLVWQDTDQNGTRDVGEQGIGSVSLQLFSTTDSVIGNGDDVSQGATTTDGSGAYAFTGLAPGKYFVKIATPPTAYPLSSGPQVALDNGVDNDNNGVQAGGVGTAIISPIFTLAVGREPGDIVGGIDADNTVDFALRAVPASLTNLLEYELNTASGGLPAPPSFKSSAVVNAAKIQIEDDMNGLTDISEPTNNGPIRSGALSRRMRDWDAAYDTGYDSTPTTLVQRPDSLWIRFDMDPTATGNIGNLLFDVYRVGTTAPVQGKVFLSWMEGATMRTVTTNVFQLSSTASWYSMNLAWTTSIGGATTVPTGAELAGKSFMIEIYLWGGDGSGYIDIDNILLQGDATTNPQSLAIGDFVWADTNGNGIKNPREPGLQNLTVQLMSPGADSLANTADDTLVSTTTTDANGYYLFSGLTAGNYFVRLPTPDPMWPTASPGVNLDNGVDNDSNGIQSGGVGTAVSSPVINLALGKEPGNLASGGGNQDMTVDFGFSAAMTMGNLVFADTNNNGLVDVGETGVEGAQMELYSSTDSTVNNGDDVKVGTTFTTGSDGLYSFSGLTAGKYFIKLTPPITHPRRSTTSSNADNGIDNDSNGISQSSTGAPIYSPMITLSALTEPGNLLAPFGSNIDNTIDFGLRPTFCRIGNLVYKDANNNGVYDSGEGVGGVRVELLNSSGSFVTSTTTSTSSSVRGRYQFTNVVPGSYYVRVPASEFATGKALVNTISIFPASSSDNDIDDNIVGNDDGIDNALPATNGISSSLISLSDSGEPINSSGESGAFNTIDDSDDNNGNMTIDFGFKSSGPSATGCYHFLAMDTNADGVLSGATEWTPAQDYEQTTVSKARNGAGTPILQASGAQTPAAIDTAAGVMHDKSTTNPALPSQCRGKPFAVVKQGSAAVPIYRGDVRGFQRFTVAFYRDGRRVRRTFGSLNAAREEARLLALNIQRGMSSDNDFRPQDREAFRVACAMLEPFGLPLVTAMAEYVQCRRKLGETPLITSVDEHVRRARGFTTGVSVSKVIEEFLAAKKQDRMSTHYLKSLQSILKQFGQALPGEIARVTTQQIDAWLRAGDYSAVTRNNRLKRVKLLFGYARQSGYLPKREPTAAEELKHRKQGDTDVGIFKPEEFELLMRTAPAELIPVLAIGAFAGLRAAEIARLDWSAVDLERKIIELRAGQAKTASRRIVPISDNLAAWLRPLPRQGLVVPMKVVFVKISKLAKSLGLAWPHNALRHSYISYRIAVVQSAAQVALEAGNSPAIIFKHYRELVTKEAADQWFAIKPEPCASTL